MKIEIIYTGNSGCRPWIRCAHCKGEKRFHHPDDTMCHECFENDLRGKLDFSRTKKTKAPDQRALEIEIQLKNKSSSKNNQGGLMESRPNRAKDQEGRRIPAVGSDLKIAFLHKKATFFYQSEKNIDSLYFFC